MAWVIVSLDPYESEGYVAAVWGPFETEETATAFETGETATAFAQTREFPCQVRELTPPYGR